MTLPPRTDGEPTLGAGETLCAINENLRLIARRDGLTFGTDAYLLAAFVRPSPRALCVDLGSGTGVLSLLLARKDKVRRAVGVEIQATFASLIARNAALCDLADRRAGADADDARIGAFKFAAGRGVRRHGCHQPAVSGSRKRCAQRGG